MVLVNEIPVDREDVIDWSDQTTLGNSELDHLLRWKLKYVALNEHERGLHGAEIYGINGACSVGGRKW